jgi:hypothetical protein
VLGLLCSLGALGPPSALAAVPAPPGRGYERVSPLDKNGADVELAPPARAAADGSAVAYTSFGGFAEGTSRTYLNQYRSARGMAGWTTANVTPPADPFPQAAFPGLPEAVSGDASQTVASSWGSDAFGRPQMINLWRYRAFDDAFDLLSQPSIPFSPDPIPASGGNHFAGASASFDHVVFTSSRRLTDDSPAGEPGFGPPYIYDWFDGQLHAVSAGAGAVLGYDSPARVANHAGDYAVSRDGTRIFFSTPANLEDPQRKLFLREDHPDDANPPTTTRIDVSERTVPAVQEEASLFQLASADGSKAFFISPEQLTDDSTATESGGPGQVVSIDRCGFARCDLYRWNADAPAGQRLTDLTTGDATGATVIAAVAAADDGSRVYFVAYGDLASGASPGEANLYLWQQNGGIHHVATLDDSPPTGLNFAADTSVWSFLLQPSGTNDPLYRDARVSSDGRYLLFRSRARATTYDTADTYQIYLYDAQAAQLSCVSCNPRSAMSTADSYLRRVAPDPSFRVPPYLPRNLSVDGSSVFFDSAEALVPQDVNQRIDVYEWSAGTLQLLSSGRSANDSSFVDASTDGHDVFFTTRQQLVGADTDALIDLYDARVGGGFPELEVPRGCTGDACQGPASSPPVLNRPGTSPILGQGNTKPVKRGKPKRCRRGLVRKRVKGKVRCVKKARKPRRR